MKEIFMQQRAWEDGEERDTAYAEQLYLRGLHVKRESDILTDVDPGDQNEETKPRNAHKQQPPKGTN